MPPDYNHLGTAPLTFGVRRFIAAFPWPAAREGLPVGGAWKAAISRRTPRTLGFTLLELEVALLILGVALAGLFPLLNMHSKALRSLEQRSASPGPWYLAPSSDTWVRKLGAGASICDTDPGAKASPPILSGDDGDPCYAEADSSWLAASNPLAYQADSRRHAAQGTPPSGTSTATWTFTSVPPSWYQVQATWLAATDQTDAARFTIYEGETSLDEVSVDQRAVPAGPVEGGTAWQTLTTKYVRDATVRVQLVGEAAVGYVVADGVRLVPIENKVQILSLTTSSTSEEATAHVSVEVLVPQ